MSVSRRCLPHSCEWDGRLVIALHNFSDKAQEVRFDSELGKDVVEVFDTWQDNDYPPPVDGRAMLGPFGYRWLRVIQRR